MVLFIIVEAETGFFIIGVVHLSLVSPVTEECLKSLSSGVALAACLTLSYLQPGKTRHRSVAWGGQLCHLRQLNMHLKFLSLLFLNAEMFLFFV